MGGGGPPPYVKPVLELLRERNEPARELDRSRAVLREVHRLTLPGEKGISDEDLGRSVGSLEHGPGPAAEADVGDGVGAAQQGRGAITPEGAQAEGAAAAEPSVAERGLVPPEELEQAGRCTPCPMISSGAPAVWPDTLSAATCCLARRRAAGCAAFKGTATLVG
jgi:hypothetical protein